MAWPWEAIVGAVGLAGAVVGWCIRVSVQLGRILAAVEGRRERVERAQRAMVRRLVSLEKRGA